MLKKITPIGKEKENRASLALLGKYLAAGYKVPQKCNIVKS